MKLLSINVQLSPAIPAEVGPVPETLEQRRGRFGAMCSPTWISCTRLRFG